MAQTQKEKDYIKNLKKLVIQIQEGDPNDETLNQLNDAKNWTCYGYNDKLLLNELIKNAEEYLDLESKSLIPFNYTKDELDRRSFLVGWFFQIHSDLKQYDTTLYQIYYCIKIPSDQFALKLSELSH